MYQTFMKHAEKVTKSPAAKIRPALQGVKHYLSGGLAVTDSHRLYYALAMHDKGDCLINPAGKVIHENYPEISRLMPNGDAKVELAFETDELIKAIDVMLTASKITGEGMDFKGDHLQINGVDLQASYQLSKATDISFLSSAQYWMDALKMFKALKYKEVTLKIYNPLRPFTLTSLDGKLLVLILPMRRY